MSDTEEVIISRAPTKTAPQAPPPPPAPSAPKTNRRPDLAREKLKEKRERLKKEKENVLIEEAMKRLAIENEKKQQEEVLAKQQEEEKKKADPTYALLMKMEQMMAMFNQTKEQPKEQLPQEPVKHRASKKKVVIPEPVPEPEPEKPKRKPRAVKQVVDKPNPSKGLPKPKKKIVYLQPDVPVQENSTQFVGYDIAPPAEPIQYQPSSGLLSALMGRRSMNSYYN
jgi:hypothetical protein